MIEMTLGQLRDENFIKAYQKLSNNPELPFKLKYHVGRLGKLLDTEIREANVQFDALIQKYAEFKEDDKQGKMWKVPEEKLSEWQTVLKEFNDTKVCVERWGKFKFSELEAAKLSANELMALEPICFELEAIEGEKKDNA